MPVMRVRRSASCLALSAFTLSVAKCASGTSRRSRCGFAIAPAAGTATCEWMSMVVDFGRALASGLSLLARGGRAVAVGVGHCFFSPFARIQNTPRCCAMQLARSVRISAAVPVKHHRAGIHDHHLVGKVERELDVLLDQHDREAFGLQLRDGAADFGDDLRREAFGGLVHQQHARIAHQARGRSRASAARRRRASPRPARDAPSGAGTASNTRSRVHGCRSSRACRATSRFSRTVSERNMRRPCGTRQMPLRAIVSGARPATVLAEQRDRAAARASGIP